MQTITKTTDTTTSVTTATTMVGSNIRPFTNPKLRLRLGMEREVVFVAFPETGEEAAREYMTGAEKFQRIQKEMEKRGRETWTVEEKKELNEIKQRVEQLRNSPEVQEFYDLIER